MMVTGDNEATPATLLFWLKLKAQGCRTALVSGRQAEHGRTAPLPELANVATHMSTTIPRKSPKHRVYQA